MQTQINSVIELYSNGQIQEALDSVEILVKDYPNEALLYNVSGACYAGLGQLDTAVKRYEQAIEIKPDYAEAHNNLGNTLKELDQLDTALKSYKKALDIKPKFAEAHYNLAIAQQGLNQLDNAVKHYEQALAIKPDYTEAFNHLGSVLNELGKPDTAVKSYEKILSIKPDFAEAHYNLAVTLQELNQLDDAVKHYEQAIEIKPDYAEAHNNLGIVHKELDQLDDAVKHYEQAIEIKPDYAEAHYNLGILQKDLSQLDAALNSLNKALTIEPDYADAYINMGNALNEKGDLDAAIGSFRQALKIKPDYAEAYYNMGVALNDKSDLEAAIDSYKQALKIKPNYADANYNLSLLYLLRSNLDEGFKYHEWRLKTKKRTAAPARTNFIWDGEHSLSGKHFVVYEEQGLGDIIQFCRYLPVLEQKGADVTFKVKSNLHALLQTMDSKASLKTSSPEENKIDFESPLMSLPYLLKTSLETIPNNNPYLYADQSKITTWGESLSKDNFKIGICWQARKRKVDDGRSFSLSLFKGISKIPNVELISLHKGEGEGQITNIDFDVTTLGSGFDAGQDAFIDTAGVMMNCDLIITCDTAVAHLAGALGRPTWVALKYVPDWRWMLERPDSLWYPTISLCRQKNRGDWVGVFDAIEQELHSLLEQKKGH